MAYPPQARHREHHATRHSCLIHRSPTPLPTGPEQPESRASRSVPGGAFAASMRHPPATPGSNRSSPGEFRPPG
jgi:hypothetical protein